ncbi:hypothetical protein GCM10009789_64220 [Kribbella sancticallisti]|uniref:Uncharacterized protein n=1 Tax=Kribbella sancticallisti TaxID=460087 RepID=A0ABN2EA27_9ACTN
MPNPYPEDELADALDLLNGAMSADDWQGHRRRGQQERVEGLLALFPGLSSTSLEDWASTSSSLPDHPETPQNKRSRDLVHEPLTGVR